VEVQNIHIRKEAVVAVVVRENLDANPECVTNLGDFLRKGRHLSNVSDADRSISAASSQVVRKCGSPRVIRDFDTRRLNFNPHSLKIEMVRSTSGG
jgi:hypothetical protein